MRTRSSQTSIEPRPSQFYTLLEMSLVVILLLAASVAGVAIQDGLASDAGAGPQPVHPRASHVGDDEPGQQDPARLPPSDDRPHPACGCPAPTGSDAGGSELSGPVDAVHGQPSHMVERTDPQA